MENNGEKGPWKIMEKKFFMSAEEAEEEILKNTAHYVKEKKKGQEDDTESSDQGYPSKPETTAETAPLPLNMMVRIDNLQLENIQREQSAPVRIFIHDFAGQSIFYDTHFYFLKMLCPYLLVFDLNVGLNTPAQPRFKFKSVDVERKQNDPLLETNLARLFIVMVNCSGKIK